MRAEEPEGVQSSGNGLGMEGTEEENGSEPLVLEERRRLEKHRREK